MDFCHRRGKLLRDIKLSNVLLAISQGQLPLVKLCDFTISRDVLRDHDESQVGRREGGGLLSCLPLVRRPSLMQCPL